MSSPYRPQAHGSHLTIESQDRPCQIMLRIIMFQISSTLRRLYSGNTIADPLSVEEKGRIWQNYKPDRYFLPNDAVEQDRLDFASYRGCCLMLHMIQDPHTRSAALDDVLHLAPVKGDPLRVLDIGTGTGPELLVRTRGCGRRVGARCTVRLHSRSAHVHVLRQPHGRRTQGRRQPPARRLVRVPGPNAQHRLGRQHAPRHGAAQFRAPCDIEVSRKYKDYPAEAGFVDIIEVKFKLFGNDWSETEPERTPDEYSIVLDAEVTRAISDKLPGEGLGLPDEIIKLIVP
ncbi:hypothetical protein SUNI508_08197 [Seiridium unicorne]|uniref:Uncharacterized protein n=1 Tax=Seiridium unicorne TaxID=138068 RepID=A0ABR2UV29_9PEZI